MCVTVLQVKMKKRCDLSFDNNYAESSTQDVAVNEGDASSGTPNSNNTQVCHTVSTKKCETFYRPQVTKVKVRVCPNSIDLDRESRRRMENR